MSSQPKCPLHITSPVAVTLAAVAWLAIAGPVRAQNLLANPDFDNSYSGWTLIRASIDTSPQDANGCPQSLSLQLGSEFFNGLYIADAEESDCHAVTPGETIFLAMSYLSSGQVSGLYRACFDNAGCAGGFTQGDNVLVGGPTGVFSRIEGTTTIPSGCNGVRFHVFSAHTSQTHTLLADRLYAGRTFRVLSDDFEGGSFCRWSSLYPI